ncbi:uncharacterized protein RCO7_14694 [Rhynchosporium graminicola]|uniref:Uncharacterized protein n=1 Tax=Rhynchosporium graminicola TaxID=2792576 RepID=A0A1E1KZ64_9HELO|nr:uncharacterized protein RCO7_14694 [Rhynchosporium commune]
MPRQFPSFIKRFRKTSINQLFPNNEKTPLLSEYQLSTQEEASVPIMLPIPSEESSEVTVQEFIASYLEAICRINTEEAIALSRRFRGSGIALYMMTTQEYTEMFGDTRIWSVKMRMEVHKETLKPAVQRISRVWCPSFLQMKGIF